MKVVITTFLVCKTPICFDASEDGHAFSSLRKSDSVVESARKPLARDSEL